MVLFLLVFTHFVSRGYCPLFRFPAAGDLSSQHELRGSRRQGLFHRSGCEARGSANGIRVRMGGQNQVQLPGDLSF